MCASPGRILVGAALVLFCGWAEDVEEDDPNWGCGIVGVIPNIKGSGVATGDTKELIDGLKVSSTFGKTHYWNWNLAPMKVDQGPQYLTKDFIFMPEQWGVTAVNPDWVREAGSTNFIDSKGEICVAEMANVFLNSNEPDIYGSCMGNMMGKCEAPCDQIDFDRHDCPIADLHGEGGQPNARHHCDCSTRSQATGVGFWGLPGCQKPQPLPTMFEDARCTDQVIDWWKQTAKIVAAKGYKYLSTPLVAVDIEYARKFLEKACGCTRPGVCSCTTVECGCPVYVGFHFYAYDCQPEKSGGYKDFQNKLGNVSKIMDDYPFVKGAIVNEVGMLNCNSETMTEGCVPNSGKYPASSVPDHGCPSNDELPDGLATYIDHLFDMVIAAKAKDGRSVVKAFSWFSMNMDGGTYNLRLFDEAGHLNKVGRSYIKNCQRWGGPTPPPTPTPAPTLPPPPPPVGPAKVWAPGMGHCCYGVWTQNFDDYDGLSDEQRNMLEAELQENSPKLLQYVRDGNCPYGQHWWGQVTWHDPPDDLKDVVVGLSWLMVVAAIYSYVPYAIAGLVAIACWIKFLQAGGCSRCAACCRSLCKGRQGMGQQLDALDQRMITTDPQGGNKPLFSARYLWVLAFGILNVTFQEWILKGWVFKEYESHPRPGTMLQTRDVDGKFVGSCVSTCGFPSGHSSLAVGWFTFIGFDMVKRIAPHRRDSPSCYDTICHFLELFSPKPWPPKEENAKYSHFEFAVRMTFWALIMLPVPYMRCVLYDHTPEQAIVGSFCGVVTATLWFKLVMQRFQRKKRGTETFLYGFIENDFVLPEFDKKNLTRELEIAKQILKQNWGAEIEVEFELHGGDGIGLECDSEGCVTKVIREGHAHYNGIKEGDRIKRIDGAKWGREGKSVLAKAEASAEKIGKKFKVLFEVRQDLEFENDYNDKKRLQTKEGKDTIFVDLNHKWTTVVTIKDLQGGELKSFKADKDEICWEKAYKFSGKHGIICTDDGVVQKVIDHSQADIQGIEKGFWIVKINTEEFSKERLADAEKKAEEPKGRSSYTLTVRRSSPNTNSGTSSSSNSNTQSESRRSRTEHVRWIRKPDA